MVGVLLLGDAEARCAGVEIGTLATFVTGSSDGQITKIAHGIVCHGGRWSGLRSRRRVIPGADAAGGTFAFARKYSMHDDAAWFPNVEELVERIVLLCTTNCHARAAQIEI